MNIKGQNLSFKETWRKLLKRFQKLQRVLQRFLRLDQLVPVRILVFDFTIFCVGGGILCVLFLLLFNRFLCLFRRLPLFRTVGIML
jgi:hypothetical protein